MADILDDHGLEVEYAVIRDSGTLLAPVDGQTTRALIAVRLGHIRLIDNGIVNQ
jgi:pantothenate synthetase